MAVVETGNLTYMIGCLSFAAAATTADDDDEQQEDSSGHGDDVQPASNHKMPQKSNPSTQFEKLHVALLMLLLLLLLFVGDAACLSTRSVLALH